MDDDQQDDLTLVYMWAFKKGEEKSKARIEELEAALQKIRNRCSWCNRDKWCGSIDCPCIIAFNALGEK